MSLYTDDDALADGYQMLEELGSKLRKRDSLRKI